MFDKIKAYKIDVISRTIYEVFLNKNNEGSTLESLYSQLDCHAIDAVYSDRIPRREAIYVDDEGLLRDQPLGAFSILGGIQVYSGHGIIVSTDDEGADADSRSTLELLTKLVTFHDIADLPKPGFTFYPG